MAKAKFDVKIDEWKSEATKGLYAGAGVADLAVEAVRGYVTDVNKRMEGLQKDLTSKVTEVRGDVTTKVSGAQKDVTTRVTEVRSAITGLEVGDIKTLPAKTTALVNTRVEAITAEAKARRSAVESKVAELRTDAKELPNKAQLTIKENVATAGSTYGDLVKRGEVAVKKLRGEKVTTSTQAKKTTTSQSGTAKKAPGRQSTAARSATAKQTPANRTSAAKSTTAQKSTAQKSTAQKSTAAKSTGGSTAKKAPAKKTSSSAGKSSTTKSSTAKKS